jgi:hypothetical protein
MSDTITNLKLSIKFTISHLTTLLALPPEELLKTVDRTNFTDFTSTNQCTPDVCFIIENLQEALNLTLDARKRLLVLDLYGLEDEYEKAERKAREQEVQIRARKEISSSLEEVSPKDTSYNPTHIPPDEEMEI